MPLMSNARGGRPAALREARAASPLGVALAPRHLLSWLVLLALLGGCVPARSELDRRATAELTRGDEGVVFTPQQAVEGVRLFLGGAELRTDDARCRDFAGGEECDLGRVGADESVPLQASAQPLQAAALWTAADGRPPFPLLTRLGGSEDGAGAGDPAALQALAPTREESPWAGEPDFSVAELTPAAAEWYPRMWTAIDTSDMMQNAASGDLYSISRALNLQITSLLLVFSQTGDLTLLDTIDEAMQLARAKLRDAWLDGEKDGYRGWLYLREADRSTRYYGKDNIELDDMLAHGMVAAVAYAYELNRFRDSPGGVDYNERFEFWSDYLLHDWEAKWRKRTRTRTGFPFVTHFLMHPTVGMLRYYYYMGKMGYDDHARAAGRLGAELADHFQTVPTPGGDAYVFDHGFSEPYAMAETTYARYTMPVVLELGIMGLSPFDEPAFMTPFARTVAYLMLDREPFQHDDLMASDVAGGVALAGIGESADARNDVRYSSYFLGSFTPFVRFDDSGRIREAADAFAAKNDNKLELPAGMVFALESQGG